jgi:hypothetical protein
MAAARRELARLPAVLSALLSDVDDETARRRPVGEEWSPVEIVCHLRDEETDDFQARLRAVLEGRHELAPIDPESWAIERGYRDERIALALDELASRRRATLEFLDRIDPDRLLASIPHRSVGRLSGADLLAAWVCHDRVHLHQITGALARVWARQWAPLRSDYAGPIPYGDEPRGG